MSIRVSMFVAEPSEIELTLTATMSLADWREVKLELESSARSPIWELHNKIKKTIEAAEERFIASRGDDE